MAAKKRVLGLFVLLGVAIGAVCQMRWMDRREMDRVSACASTNAVVVVQTAVTNAAVSATTNLSPRASKTPPPAPVSKCPEIAPTTPSSTPKTLNSKLPTRNLPSIPKARQVLLANRRIAVATGRSFPKRFCAAQTPTVRGTAPYVVISEVPVNRDVRIQAVANGARVVGFLPNNALLVEADAQTLKNLESDALFMAAVEYEPTDKIQRALLEATGETVEATVVVLNDADLPSVCQFVTDNGGVPLPNAPSVGTSLCAKMPRTLVETLAGKAEVKWIECYGHIKLDNDIAVQAALMNVASVREDPLGLTGAGQIITTSDTGIDTGNTRKIHDDFKGAISGIRGVEISFMSSGYTADYSGHGTHTAGSIVGRGTMSDGQFKGAAPGAMLWAWGMMGSDGYLYTPNTEDLFRPTTGRWGLSRIDAYIHSASWGSDTNLGEYVEQAVEYDTYVWSHADFLPVFAAGNDGSSAGTVNVPGTAKNVLTVGASENLRTDKGSYANNPAQIVYFSSRGPCADGRIKPDLVAPGTYVMSCLSTQASRCTWDDGSYDDYQYMSGTSMATPLVAGTAALVREWLVKHRAQTTPSAALVKAILTGGTTDLHYESGNNVLSSVPDTRQGWGRVNLADAIAPTNGLGVFLADWLPFKTGTNFTFRVTTTNVAPFNAQLVWVDYPGSEASAKALVNNLDLCVRTVDETWFGNGGTVPDEVNNVETVRLRAAAARTYMITVACTTVPYDSTEGGAAALYLRGAFDPQKVACDPRDGTIWIIR